VINSSLSAALGWIGIGSPVAGEEDGVGAEDDVVESKVETEDVVAPKDDGREATDAVDAEGSKDAEDSKDAENPEDGVGAPRTLMLPNRAVIAKEMKVVEASMFEAGRAMLLCY
jgi:hypothetical protein